MSTTTVISGACNSCGCSSGTSPIDCGITGNDVCPADGGLPATMTAVLAGIACAEYSPYNGTYTLAYDPASPQSYHFTTDVDGNGNYLSIKVIICSGLGSACIPTGDPYGFSVSAVFWCDAESNFDPINFAGTTCGCSPFNIHQTGGDISNFATCCLDLASAITLDIS